MNSGWIGFKRIKIVAGHENLDDEQLNWFRQDLEQVADDKPTMIISSIPILPACIFFDGDKEII
jgi:hypothetical protein